VNESELSNFKKEESMSVTGTYDCATKTPMGDQSGILTVVPNDEGTAFTGTMIGAMGNVDVQDGKIDANMLSWKMKIVVPIPMTLECEAAVEGDELNGQVKAGGFGTMPFSGKRRG
jgi:hypothetical protein